MAANAVEQTRFFAFPDCTDNGVQEGAMVDERSFKRKQSEFFDTLSSTFCPEPGGIDLLPDEYLRTVAKALSATFPRDFRGGILEVGCGLGQNSVTIARLCPRSHVVGIDISFESLRKARAAAQ